VSLFFDCPADAVVRVAFTSRQWDELRAHVDHLAHPISVRETLENVRGRLGFFVLYLTHVQACALWKVFRPRGLLCALNRDVSRPKHLPTGPCAVCLLLDSVEQHLEACIATGGAARV